MLIITSHTSLDFDGLASMVAASKLYPNGQMVFAGPLTFNVRDFMSLHKDIITIKNASEIDLSAVQEAVIVDTRVPSQLGDCRSVINNPKITLRLYDHHPQTQQDITAAYQVIKETGATTTILLEEIQQKKIPLTPIEATLLALGIYEDTGSFTFLSTTFEDLQAAAYLVKQGANLKVVANFIHHTLNEEQKRLLNTLILSLQSHSVNGYRVGIATAEVADFIEELALLTHRLFELDEMDAIFTLVLMKDRLYIVGRSKINSINVNEILIPFGGNGHRTAAAAMLKNSTLEETKERILAVTRDLTKPILLASNIMSYPVKGIKENATIDEAGKLLFQYGHSGLVVYNDKEELVGIISRRDVDKAIHHGLSHAPVKAYMSKNVITTSKDQPLPEIQRLMTKYDIGRLPVLDLDKIVGIITRTDILRFIHGEEQVAPSSPTHIKMESFNKLPSHIQNFLQRIGQMAEEESVPVFAVGGFVRDLLLEEENFDIDLVVEGDGIAFARKLAEEFGGRLRSHNKFKTAVLVLKDGFKIDIVSSRTEYYEHPAALPQVEGSSLKQDLYRRDFTINSMAIQLNSSQFGRMVDFFGGQRDLKMGILRVHHNLSFIDDPTRIFRAIRFEQRYQFRMDRHTETLLKNALLAQVLNNVGNERIKDEIILILSEINPNPAIKRMDKLGILKLIHPDIVLNSKNYEALEEIYHTLNWYQNQKRHERIDKWLVYFMALISQLDLKQINLISQKFSVTEKERKKLTVSREETTNLIKLLNYANLNPSEIYLRLSHLSIEFLLFLIARSKSPLAKQRIASYLTKWYYTKPMITGKDLIAEGFIPSYQFQKILSTVFSAQLDGLLKNKEEALVFAKDWFKV